MANELLLGNYPLTVGIDFAQDQAREVTVRHGKFRVCGGYDPPVRVPEEVLKCVGFVGEATHKNPDGSVEGDLHATGFFVAVPAISPELTGMITLCFVTAKHVATDLQGREVYFLVNKKGGGVTFLTSVYGSRWWLHPTDKTADVAVIPINHESSMDIKAVHFANLGTPQLLEKLKIGIGDELFMTGLFAPAPSVGRLMPIVRHGTLAMMPEEQIQTELGYADVYLAEARSIGGLSGSPVFVHPTLILPLPPNPTGFKHAFCLGHGATLLGLMHGHWDIKEADINKATITHDAKRGVNLGIGIVVPAHKIAETIMRPELAKLRAEAEERAIRERAPGMDSLHKPDDSPDQEQPAFSRADFEAALKKASRKLEPPKR